MNENNSGKKILSLALLILGAVLLIAALWMDFTKTYLVVNMGSAKLALRGLFLVLGALLCLAGLYFIPTVMHHRTIINFIFLFPLLFTFAVTVIIPMFVGFFYSFTDWNGVSFTRMVGFENYAGMFKEPAFIWSLLQRCGLFPCGLLPAEPDRRYRSGLYLAVHFLQCSDKNS